MNQRLRTVAALSTVVAVAIALRAYRLGEVPFGFHPDEGHNALDAWRIAQGWRPMFLPGNNGREPLYMYLMAGVMAVGGASIRTARLAGVIAGVLAVAAQYVYVSRQPLRRPRNVALISAALVAVTFWPVAQARYALRANLLPVWVALMLWSWWRATQSAADGRATRSAGWAALTGLVMAAAIHTHITGRLLPIVVATTGLYAAWLLRSSIPIRAVLVAVAVCAVVAAPQALYFRAHPDDLTERASQVSALNPDVNEGDLAGTLLGNGRRLIMMPFVRGDSSWYHNISGRPVFGPFLGFAFLLGLMFVWRDAAGRRGIEPQLAAAISVTTLAATLAPSWLSVGAPNYVRLTGTWPVLFLIPAWGIDRAAAWVEEVRRPAPSGVVAARLLVGALILAAAGATVRDYFGSYAAAPQVFAAFNGAAVERGRHLADLARSGEVYVSPALWNQSVIRFLNLDRAPTPLDARLGLALPPTGDAVYAFDPVEAADVYPLARRWRWVGVEERNTRAGALSLIVLRLARDDWPRLPGAPPATVEVAFGTQIALLGARVEPGTVAPGGKLRIDLEWECLTPTDTDRNLFVHLVGTEGKVYGQYDGPPFGGTHTTDRWRPGERIRLSAELKVAPQAQAGSAEVRVGWYDWRTSERLKVAGDSDDAFVVANVLVAP